MPQPPTGRRSTWNTAVPVVGGDSAAAGVTTPAAGEEEESGTGVGAAVMTGAPDPPRSGVRPGATTRASRPPWRGWRRRGPPAPGRPPATRAARAGSPRGAGVSPGCAPLRLPPWTTPRFQPARWSLRFPAWWARQGGDPNSPPADRRRNRGRAP